jgi:AcrR family transcriptional regulator
MAREKLRTEIRRDQILKAVLSLIATRGAKALRMGTLARRVGLVPSALYRHFRNKDEILDAAIDLFGRMVVENLRNAMAESTDSVECLQRLLMLQIQMIRENHVLALPRIIFSEELFVSSPRRRAKVYRLLKENLGRLRDLIREGQQRGEIRANLDPGAAARMFLAMIQSSAILWYVSDGDYNVTQHAGRSWKMFRKAISVRRRRVKK